LELVKIIALFVAAGLAGALNSVAGGGSFISFPALLLTGVPSINANATNTIALWPGSVASVGAYRQELTAQRRVILPFSAISILGGLIGAVILLNTPPITFEHLIPFLLLFATLLFTFGGTAGKWVRTRFGQSIPVGAEEGAPKGHESRPRLIVVGLLQFVTAVYGGFFGGGIGIVMLALLSVLDIGTIHEMNALKVLLATFINGVAVVAFVLAGVVYWAQALLMIVGAVLGGYFGAYYARKLNPLLVRRFVIVVGFVMTAYFFIRG